jgi:hypothetical protein
MSSRRHRELRFNCHIPLSTPTKKNSCIHKLNKTATKLPADGFKQNTTLLGWKHKTKGMFGELLMENMCMAKERKQNWHLEEIIM